MNYQTFSRKKQRKSQGPIFFARSLFLAYPNFFTFSSFFCLHAMLGFEFL